MSYKMPKDCSLYGKEMFYGFEDELLRLPSKEIEKNTATNNKLDLIYKIFIYFLELVFKDIIFNDVRFQIYKASKFRLHMKKEQGEDFAKAYQNGKYWEIDPIISNYTGYRICLSRIARTYEDYKQYDKSTEFYLGWQMKEHITNRINSGGGYSG